MIRPRCGALFLVVATLVCALHALPLAAGEEDPISRARQAITAGDELFSDGKITLACRQYEVALGVAPQWWYSAYKRALCRARRGATPDALYLLRMASAARGELYILHLALAREYRKSGVPDRAVEEYEKAISLTKGAVEPMLELALVLLELGRGGEAEAVLKKAAYFASTNLAVRSRLARVAENLGHLDVAEDEFRFLAMYGVNRRRNLAELSRFYSRHDEREQAIAVLRTLKERGEGMLRPQLPPPKFKPPGTR